MSFTTSAGLVRVLLVLASAAPAVAPSSAQNSPVGRAVPRPEFDVASVKRNTSDSGPRGISFSPSGRFAWNRMTLKQLMESAYSDTSTREIAGGPSWIDSERFDIVATSTDALKDIGPDGTPRGLFVRLRALLEDRFGVKTHAEMRTLPVFSLEPAAAPFTMKAGLRKSDIDCEAIIREAAAGQRPTLPEGQLPPCSMRASPGSLTTHAMSMGRIVDALSTPAGRTVIDATGLNGYYDVTLKWAPELPAGALLNGAPAPPSDGPSLFTAIRDQLGLKLEPTRAPISVLVVDAATMPGPD